MNYYSIVTPSPTPTPTDQVCVYSSPSSSSDTNNNHHHHHNILHLSNEYEPEIFGEKHSVGSPLTRNPPLHEDCVKTGNYVIDYNDQSRFTTANSSSTSLSSSGSKINFASTTTSVISEGQEQQRAINSVIMENSDLNLIECGVICGDDLHILNTDQASGLLLEFDTKTIITFKDKTLHNLKYLKIRGISGFENIRCPNLKVLEIDVYRERCFIKDIITQKLTTLILNLESENFPIMDNFQLQGLKNLAINFKTSSSVESEESSFTSQEEEKEEPLRQFTKSNIQVTEHSNLSHAKPNFKLLQYSTSSNAPVKYIEFNTCLPNLESLTITNKGLYSGWLTLSLENYKNLKVLKCDPSIRIVYVGGCSRLNEVYSI